MSLTKTNLYEVVRKQFLFKLTAYQSVFTTLIITQIIAILFSLGGVGSSGYGYENLFVSLNYISGDMVVAFTLIWGLIIAGTITKKEYQLMDYTFVSNNLSRHLSNVLFIMSICLLGAVTSILSGFLLKMITIIFWGSANVTVLNPITISDLFIGILATFFYLLLLSGIGYLIGVLFQFHPIFKIIVPAFIIFAIFFENLSGPLGNLILTFTTETVLSWLILKVIFAFVLCIVTAILLSNRLEVRP